MQSISRTPSIYQIRHVATGRLYVGSAIDPQQRCRFHRNALLRGDHHSRYLQRTWNKYGESAFVFEIIEPVLFLEDLIPREQYWIDTLQASSPAYGFNVRSSANSNLGMKASEETRQRLSQVARNRPPVSPETRQKLSDALRRRMRSPETVRKTADAQRGKPRSPEIRQRMSDAHALRLGVTKAQKQRSRIVRGKKLTQEQAIEIRALYASGYYTQQAIAELFKVDRSLIGHVIRGDCWQD